jgi:hypothetical protein
MSAHAFADESARESHYHVCVVVVSNHDVDDLRRLVRSFCLPGQRRWHFVHERRSRRRQIITALAARNNQVSALVFHAKGRESAIRAKSFHRMVPALLDRTVTRLVIESRQGRDHLDRQVLLDELRHRPVAFGYDHMPAHSDPLLWVADAVAWCSSAGGAWRKRIDSLVGSAHHIAAP